MSTTYGELYDLELDEMYESGFVVVPSWAGGGKPASKLMKENNPVRYRCGFSDWLDTVEDMECDCGEFIPREHIINDCCMEDLVECPNCIARKE